MKQRQNDMHKYMGPPHVGDGHQADFEKRDVTITLYEFVFVLAKLSTNVAKLTRWGKTNAFLSNASKRHQVELNKNEMCIKNPQKSSIEFFLSLHDLFMASI
jgi:hypothetical protein